MKLNEHFRPFGLDCTGRVLTDTVRVMREFGIDVRNKGEWDCQGAWIQDRPLSDDMLRALVFAVSTNPYISNEKASEILGGLSPVVTVYQEPMLVSNVETGAVEKGNQELYDAYQVVSEAIKEIEKADIRSKRPI